LNINGWIYDTAKDANTFDSGNWTLTIRTQGTSTSACVGNLYVVVGKTDGTSFTTFFSGDVSSGTDVCNDGAATYSSLTIASNCNGSSNCTFDATQRYLIVNFYLHVTTNVGGNGAAISFNVEDAPDNCTASGCPSLVTSLWLPENLWVALLIMPAVAPWFFRRLRRRYLVKV
jgi:hypothetical protein